MTRRREREFQEVVKKVCNRSQAIDRNNQSQQLSKAYDSIPSNNKQHHLQKEEQLWGPRKTLALRERELDGAFLIKEGSEETQNT